MTVEKEKKESKYETVVPILAFSLLFFFAAGWFLYQDPYNTCPPEPDLGHIGGPVPIMPILIVISLSINTIIGFVIAGIIVFGKDKDGERKNKWF